MLRGSNQACHDDKTRQELRLYSRKDIVCTVNDAQTRLVMTGLHMVYT